MENPILHSAPPPTRRHRRAPTPDNSGLNSETAAESDDIHDEEDVPENQRTRRRAGLNSLPDRVDTRSKLKGPALRGLLQVRAGVVPIVQREKNSLKEALHTASLELQQRHGKVLAEIERAKFMTRKIAERTEVLNKAVEEYDRAFAVLVAAQTEGTKNNSAQVQSCQKSFLKICESLVNSWAVNVKVAKDRLSSWEFKSKSKTNSEQLR